MQAYKADLTVLRLALDSSLCLLISFRTTYFLPRALAPKVPARQDRCLFKKLNRVGGGIFTSVGGTGGGSGIATPFSNPVPSEE